MIACNHLYLDSGFQAIAYGLFGIFFRRVGKSEKSCESQIFLRLIIIFNLVCKSDYSQAMTTHFINFFNYYFLAFSINNFNTSIIIYMFALV